MANEKRLIDANAFKMFLEDVRQDYLEEDTFSSDFAAKVIETVQDEYLALAPTVDAVDIVEVVHGGGCLIMREKLIELIRKVDKEDYESRTQDEHYGFMADRLMESGVTIPVRCKDCQNRDDITGECKHPKAVGWDVLIPEDDDFCSYGEKQEV